MSPNDSEAFDPYYHWLGIPPAEQPPNHYRLLGVSLFESHPDVIANAADQRILLVRTFQIGKHSAESQRILNEISVAHVCLLNADKKAEYDAHLRSAIGASPVVVSPPPAYPSEPPVASLEATVVSDGASPGPQSAHGRATRRRTPKSPLLELVKIAVGGIAGLVIAYCLLLFVFQIDILDRLSSRKPAPSRETAMRQAEPQARHAESERTKQRLEEISKLGRSIPAGSRGPAASVAPPLAIAPFDERTAKQHQAAWAKYLNVPILHTNSIGIRFVLIPPGEFDMGSTEAEVARFLEETKATNQPNHYIERLPAEAPKHRVRITKPFYLGQCEVTQADYARVMGSNPSHFKEAPTCPVEMVTRGDASAFCRKLSELPQEHESRAGYRLPTEAEWEHACRAGATARWSSGDDDGALKEHGWFNFNAGKETHPVGQKLPNAWGLYDMHGNVWEWCQDLYDSGYYGKSLTDDPQGPTTGSLGVARGGSWVRGASFGRASYRYWVAPDSRGGVFGFRLARTVPLGTEMGTGVVSLERERTPD